MQGGERDRIIENLPVTEDNAVHAALASVGMGSVTVGGVERSAAGYVSH